MMRRTGLAARGLFLAVSAFAATLAGATDLPQPALPPYSAGYQPVGVDERGLWMEADELEREFKDSRLLVRDEALNNYVRGVLCRAVGEDRCKGVRIYIVRDASFNAGMYPNGMLQVNTGTLLRLRSEAELAAVLAHEFGHFELRHQLASYRRQRNATDAIMWIGVAVGGYGAGLQLAIAGSIFRFQREEESAADARSFAYLETSPYRAAAFPDIWERMMAERDATAAARNQRSHSSRGASFFDTHPSSAERLAALKVLASKRGTAGEDGVESYSKELAAWRPQFLADQIKLNDFGGSEYILAQLAKPGWTADLLVARGDLYRLRGNQRDLQVAAQSYRDAIAQGPTDAGVERDLGMVLLRSGARADAATAFQQYLTLRPEAADKTMVAMLINQANPTMAGGVMSAQATMPATPAPAARASAPAAAQADAAVAGSGGSGQPASRALTLAPVSDSKIGEGTK